MSEKEIILGCIQNNAHSQRALFDKYAKRMMTLCLRYSNFQKQDAEDVLQEGFVRIFDKIHLYKDFGSFEGWMKRIFINIAIRHNQNSKKKEDISNQLNDNVSAIQVPEALNNLSAEEILDVIADLPQGYQIVFNLSVIDGYSHNEIAQILDIKPATSRSQLTKAKQLLKQLLTNSQHIVPPTIQIPKSLNT